MLLMFFDIVTTLGLALCCFVFHKYLRVKVVLYMYYI